MKEGREEGGRCSEQWHLSSQVTITCDGALLSFEMADLLPAHG